MPTSAVPGRAPAAMRELLPPGGARKKRSEAQLSAAAVSGFDYPATQVGVAANVTVYYDPALGSPGLSLAKQLVNAGPGLLLLDACG